MRKITLSLMLFLLCAASITAQEWIPLFPAPDPEPEPDAADTIRLRDLDQAAEKSDALPLAGTISRSQLAEMTATRGLSRLDIPLAQFTSFAPTEFAAPDLARTTKGYLGMKPNALLPGNTFGFWASPQFTIAKPGVVSEFNSVNAYVAYNHTGVPAGYKTPTFRIRLNSADNLMASTAQFDGNHIGSAAGSGVLTCRFDLNLLNADRAFTLSVDIISLESSAFFNYALEVTGVYLIRAEAPSSSSNYEVEGVWQEDDYELKASINGAIITLLDDDDCYHAAWNDKMVVSIMIYNAWQREYDTYVWADNKSYLLNEEDTFMVCAAGDYAVYLEQDGDVKAWSPFTNTFADIFNNDAMRISSGGGNWLMIWDEDENLYIWHPAEGLFKVDEDDIRAICNTTSLIVP